jgi:hypothetical protein
VARSLRELIFKRRHAYRQVFLAGGQLGTAAAIVLADLRRFCRATTSTTVVSAAGSVDPIATALAEGRREVFLRICQHLHVSDADLYALVEDDIDNTP